MNRRERLSADVRREQLMDATIEVLSTRGFHDATADQIARLAGVSKGLLWRYFTDLDSLFELTARRIITTLAGAVGATIDLGGPAPVVIRSAVHAAAQLRLTHPAERRAMREIVMNLRRDGEPRFTQADLEDLYVAQEAIFRRGQQDGAFRSTLDPRLLAVTYQGAVDAMLSYLDAHPDADPDAHADTVADVLLDGIAARS